MECVDRLKVIKGETSRAISVTVDLEMAKQNEGSDDRPDRMSARFPSIIY